MKGEKRKPLEFSYEPDPIDVLTVEGTKYAGDLFREVGLLLPRGVPFCVDDRRDGAVAIRRLEGEFLGSHEGPWAAASLEFIVRTAELVLAVRKVVDADTETDGANTRETIDAIEALKKLLPFFEGSSTMHCRRDGSALKCAEEDKGKVESMSLEELRESHEGWRKRATEAENSLARRRRGRLD